MLKNIGASADGLMALGDGENDVQMFEVHIGCQLMVVHKFQIKVLDILSDDVLPSTTIQSPADMHQPSKCAYASQYLVQHHCRTRVKAG